MGIYSGYGIQILSISGMMYINSNLLFSIPLVYMIYSMRNV